MKMVVRAFALMLFVGTIGIWAGLGGSLEWTKTKTLSDRASGFVPGVEFLALGVGGAVLIFAATLFVRITPKSGFDDN